MEALLDGAAPAAPAGLVVARLEMPLALRPAVIPPDHLTPPRTRPEQRCAAVGEPPMSEVRRRARDLLAEFERGESGLNRSILHAGLVRRETPNESPVG